MNVPLSIEAEAIRTMRRMAESIKRSYRVGDGRGEAVGLAHRVLFFLPDLDTQSTMTPEEVLQLEG